MKERVVFLFLSLAVLLTTCATFSEVNAAPPEYWGIVPLSFKQVISEPSAYSTEKGRRLMIKYKKNLGNLFINVRKTFTVSEIEFIPYIPNKSSGLAFMKLNESKSDERFLSLTVMAPFNFYDKRHSTYQERAAAIFAKYARGLIEVALQETQVLNDSDVSGVWISISWSTMDAKSTKRGEALTLIAAKDDCRAFLSNALTPQVFINKITIKGIQEGMDLGTVTLVVGPDMKTVDTLNKKVFALSLFETGTELITGKRPRLSISFFDRAIELSPNYSEAYYFRGSAYAALSMREASLTDVETALKLSRDETSKHFMSAGLSAMRNDLEEACRSLEMAIKSGSEGDATITRHSIPNIIQVDAIFNSIRGYACYGKLIGGK
jgi:tetratricopeptide (TPR) repeat protein